MIEDYKKRESYSSAHICAAVKRSIFTYYGADHELYMGDVTPQFLTGYEHWLTVTKKCSWNTSSLYIRFIRIACNRALEDGNVKHIPNLFKHVFTHVTRNHERALLPKEMRMLITPDAADAPAGSGAPKRRSPRRPILKAALYLELLVRLQGISFRDLATLRKADVHGDYIVFRRQKTGVEVHIRLTESVRNLLGRCKADPDSPFLLNLLDSTLTGEALYNNYCRALRNMNYYLKKLALLRGVCRKVSSYCARHTWATVAKDQKIPLLVIAECLGHTSATTTEAYLKASDNNCLDAANATVVKHILG
jgi:integrase